MVSCYWLTQQALAKVPDKRFNHQDFQVLPYFLVKQVIASYRSSVNTEHLSSARLSLIQLNINRAEGVPAYDNIGDFLPYPSQYLIDCAEISIDVDAKTAIEFLDSYEKFDPEVELAFTPWLTSLKAIVLRDF